MERLTPIERAELRVNASRPEAKAANPLTCRAIVSLLEERDELEAALLQIEGLTWGGKAEPAVHIIASAALKGGDHAG